MNWFKRLFGGEQKPTPDTREKLKAAFVAPLMPSSTPSPASKWVPTPSSIQGDPVVLTLAPGITLSLVRVPAGEFIMGSSDADPDAHSDEKPQHDVYLDEYLIGKYEVTVAQFRAFVQATGHLADSRALPSGKDDHPVTYVNANDAFVFYQWVSKVTGRYVHLPDGNEWEKAARGTDGRIYPWGNEKPDSSRAYYSDVVGRTTRVGIYPNGASPYGVMDMAGNVTEMVRGGDMRGGHRCNIRESSWEVRAASRTHRDFLFEEDHGGYILHIDRNGNTGFRCVVSPEK